MAGEADGQCRLNDQVLFVFGHARVSRATTRVCRAGREHAAGDASRSLIGERPGIRKNVL